jgi:hypothetical protein
MQENLCLLTKLVEKTISKTEKYVFYPPIWGVLIYSLITYALHTVDKYSILSGYLFGFFSGVPFLFLSGVISSGKAIYWITQIICHLLIYSGLWEILKRVKWQVKIPLICVFFILNCLAYWINLQ